MEHSLLISNVKSVRTGDLIMETMEIFDLLELKEQEYETLSILYKKSFDYTKSIRSDLTLFNQTRLSIIAKKLKEVIDYHFNSLDIQSKTRQLLNGAKAIDSSIEHYQRIRNVHPSLEMNIYIKRNSGLNLFPSEDKILQALGDYEVALLDLYSKFNIKTAEEKELKNLLVLSIDAKQKVQSLLEEAITLISEDEYLKPRKKEKLISDLKSIIRDLSSNDFLDIKLLGRVRALIITLGALGSVINASFSISDHLIFVDAQSKVQEAGAIIETVTVNNYIQSSDHSEYFNSQKLLLGSPPPKQLPPSNDFEDAHNTKVIEAEVLEENRPTQEEMMEIVESLLGCAKTDKPAPTDEEVEEMLLERLVEKYK